MLSRNKKVKKGKIYKIIALIDNYDINDVYYGSTTQKLCRRFNFHKSDYINKKKAISSSSIIFDKYGLENCKIILIEEFDYINKEDLCKKEAEYILNNKCVNKRISYKSKEDKIKDKIIYDKNYRELNKEKKLKNHKLYYQLNKEKLSKSNTCECGGLYKTYHKTTHMKTKKHKEYIKTKE